MTQSWAMDAARHIALDKQEIAEHVTRYAYAVDFGEFASFRAVLADDVRTEFVMRALGRDDISVAGADALVERMSSRGEAPMVPRHAMTNHLVDVDGDQRTLALVPRERERGLHVRPRGGPDGWRMTTLEVRMFA